MRHFYLVAGILVMLYVNGCASIVSGTDQIVTFNSEPDGAKVIVAGRAIGTTPLSVQVKRVTNQTLTFEKDGYNSHTTPFSTATNSWFWGNILIGGLLGSTTDGASGAMYEYSPDNYFITLTPSGTFGAATSKPRQVKEFVTSFGGEIRSGLATGSGEELNALFVLLNVEPANKASSINLLNQLSIRNHEDLDFAQSIIDEYGIK